MDNATTTRKKRRLAYGELSALARATGRSVGHLSRYLRGERPSKKLDAVLLELFGVTPEDVEIAHRRHDPAQAAPA